MMMVGGLEQKAAQEGRGKKDAAANEKKKKIDSIYFDVDGSYFRTGESNPAQPRVLMRLTMRGGYVTDTPVRIRCCEA